MLFRKNLKTLSLFLCISSLIFFTSCNNDELFQIQRNDSYQVSVNEYGEQVLNQPILVEEKPEIINAKLTAVCSGNLQKECSVQSDYPNYRLNNTPGLIGSPIKVTLSENVQNPKLTLTYSEEELRGIPEKNIRAVYTDEEVNVFDIMSTQLSFDYDKNEVTFPVTQNGIYLLVDIYQQAVVRNWPNASDYAYEKDITAYQSDWERECDTGNIMMLADKKWAVENAPDFKVSNVKQLASVVYYANVINDSEITLTLENDIDLSNYDWKPMGWDSSHGVILHLNGQNHTIYGLYIDSTQQFIGFLGYAYSVEMKNVSFKYAQIKNNGNGWAGILCGTCFGTKSFENVSVEGRIYGNENRCGSFVGDGSYGHYENCQTNVKVNDEDFPYFSSDDKYMAENSDETAYTLTVNSDNNVQRTENSKYDRLQWVIFFNGKHLMSRGAENELEIPKELWKYLESEKGNTYTIYLEGFAGSGYIRVSNIIEYKYK